MLVVSMLVRPEGRTLLGSAIPRYQPAVRLTVSMLVRPEGRTLQERLVGLCDWRCVFQCSSAPKDGRYAASRSRAIHARRLRFNARPPRRTDATVGAPYRHHASQTFQCSSAPKDGRYPIKAHNMKGLNHVSMLVRPEGRTLLHRNTSDPTFKNSFNARPPRRTDATYSLITRYAPPLLVSMLVRPEGRTLRALSVACSQPTSICFNARPPRRTDATKRTACGMGGTLGFNARPPRRTDATRPIPRFDNRQDCVSMLVRPEGRTLPTSSLCRHLRPQRFQCSSAPKDGRYRPLARSQKPLCCFNARPPRRTDATERGWESREGEVSMLVRPEGRTLLGKPILMQNLLAGFNARPPRRTDATQRPRDKNATCQRFNARPPRRTDATGQVLVQGALRVRGFNARPPRRTDATAAQSISAINHFKTFQCSSAPKDGRYTRAFTHPTRAAQSCFNARPPRRTDATIILLVLPTCHQKVSMLVRPEGRTLHGCHLLCDARCWFQCSSAPKDGRYCCECFGRASGMGVSMLVRPEGRTLPTGSGSAAGRLDVSMLVRPEGRTLRAVGPTK